jgi:DNA-binding NtrC family response regulator
LVAADPLCTKWRGLLRDRPMRCDCVCSHQEAEAVLAAAACYELLLIDADLKGGDWRELLPRALASGKVGAAIVLARHGDHQLWAEVLQLGAHDLVAEPYERLEIARIIDGALDSHQFSRLNKATSRNERSTLV